MKGSAGECSWRPLVQPQRRDAAEAAAEKPTTTADTEVVPPPPLAAFTKEDCMKRGFCIAFQTGACKKGKECPYLHQKGKSTDRSKSPPRGARERGRSPKRASSPERSDVSKVPCKFYAEGKCTRDKCPFLHAPKPGGGAAVATEAPSRPSGGMAARSGSSSLSRSASTAAVLAGLLTCIVPADTFLVPPSLPVIPRSLGVLPSSFLPPV